MKKLTALVVWAALTAGIVSTAQATYIATADAKLDLAGMIVSFSGTSFNWTGDYASANASAFNPSVNNYSFSYPGSATATTSHAGYTGTATATNDSTKLQSTLAVVDGDAGPYDYDGAFAYGNLYKYFTTTGAGILTISIPYTLSYDLTGTDPSVSGYASAYAGSNLGFNSYQGKSDQVYASLYGIDAITGTESGIFTFTKTLSGNNDGYLNLYDQVYTSGDGAPVPEPGTMVLLGFGMFGLAIYGKRRMNNNQA